MASIYSIDVIIPMRKEIMIPDFVKVGLFGQVRPVGEVVWKSEIIWISYFLQLLRFIELEIAKNIQIIPNIEFKMPNHELWKRNVNKLMNCLSSQPTWTMNHSFHRQGVGLFFRVFFLHLLFESFFRGFFFCVFFRVFFSRLFFASFFRVFFLRLFSLIWVKSWHKWLYPGAIGWRHSSDA